MTALGRTVSSVGPHATLARTWDGSGVSGRVGAGGQAGPWPREAGGLAGPPDPREGAAFQSQLSVVTIPCWGLQWLSSAAHAVLDIHKAQALPAFPLLCHLLLELIELGSEVGHQLHGGVELVLKNPDLILLPFPLVAH